jgi:hypothetical protein
MFENFILLENASFMLVLSIYCLSGLLLIVYPLIIQRQNRSFCKSFKGLVIPLLGFILSCSLIRFCLG